MVLVFMAFGAAPQNTMGDGFGFVQHLLPLLHSEPTLYLGEPLLSELSLGALWEGTHFIFGLQKRDDWNVWAAPPPPLATGVASEIGL